MPLGLPIHGTPDYDLQYLCRLSGVSGIPYRSSDPGEMHSIAQLWVEGLIEADLPPISPDGWKGTATVMRVSQRGLDLLRQRGLMSSAPAATQRDSRQA
jgi:hypothetical protein